MFLLNENCDDFKANLGNSSIEYLYILSLNAAGFYNI